MDQNLEKIFEDRFHCKPKYAVRCPGRVNLIGEHTDYSGYGVLPMAVTVSTQVLVSWHDSDEICFYNTDSAFPAAVHKLDEDWIGKPSKWYYYFLCGWKGILEHLNLQPRGINVLLSGTIPPSSGLSSSASIVCASALATVALHTGKTFELISKEELADRCAKFENYIGVESGGMDQAIEVLGKSGRAMMIDFRPLRYAEVILPEDAVFAVLHCGRTLSKSETSHYNERVVECRTAAQIISKRSGIENWKAVRTLKEAADALNKGAESMLDVARSLLTESIYTRESIRSLLEISDKDFANLSLSSNTQHMEKFKLRQRAEHVFSEAARVLQFRDACAAGDIDAMGRLMNQSHESCRDLYECSCQELDQTVERCLGKGALGARLTGAGWGGCVVALFHKNHRPELDVLLWSEPAAGIELKECS